MTETANGDAGPPQDLFDPFTRTNIAQLALGRPDSDSSPYVEAVVSLIWPYSNKNRLLSLLLAEPDVRLRCAKGQLKVTFHGSGAREVAKSQVGIGDVVRLRLEGATWTDTGDSVLTPGKKVNWDLHFKNRVILDVKRKDNLLVTIDYEGSDTPPPKPKSLPVNGYYNDSSIAFSTPAAGQSKRVSSGSFIDASLDPFADDDGFVLGKGRKRTKFGRTSGSWRLVDEGEDDEKEEELEVGSEVAAAPTTEEGEVPTSMNVNIQPEVVLLDISSSSEPSPVEKFMAPPLNPFRRPPEKRGEAAPETENATTPRLRPLASPGLPLVSPLIKSVGPSVGYFGIQPSTGSELDIISIASTSPDKEEFARPSASAESSNNDLSEANEGSTEDDTMQPSQVQPSQARGSFGQSPSPTFSAPFEMRSTAFNKTAPSPFGSASGGFGGFSPKPSTGSSFSGFGNTATPSSFVAPSTSFGSPTGFASFGTSNGFGQSAGFGTVGFGFGIPSTNTEAKPLTGNQKQPGSQVLIENLSEQEQDKAEPANEQSIHSPVVGKGSEIHHRERSQSQHTDDDMYGPGEPEQQNQSAVSVISGSPVSMHHNWQEKIHITAVDVETGVIPSPPFPFPRKWNEKQQRERRRLRRSPYLDGASDDVSEPDKDARTSPESASTQTPSEEERISEAGDLSDIEVPKSAPTLEMVPGFETVTKAQIALGPVLELEGSAGIHMQMEEPQSVQVISDDEDPREPAEEVRIHGELRVELSSDVHGVLVNKAPVEGDFVPPLLNGANLLTPDNTQQDAQDTSSLEPVQQVPSLQMPPTPDNTQEVASAAMIYMDGANDFHPFEHDKANMEISSPSPEQDQMALSQSLREALNIPAVSSPYFTSRRSRHLSPERQVVAGDKFEARINVDYEAVTDLPVAKAAIELRQLNERESLSPAHDKRAHNMLGLVTPVSYYTSLSNLDEHFNHLIDVLAVCTAKSDAPSRSRAGPRDYYVTLHMADSFLNGTQTVTTQVFRPYKEALPAVQRGDAILLRSFKVQSQKRKMMLLSTNSSAWAVFSLSDIFAKDAEYWDLRIDARGPPVEFGPEEQVYAKKLLEWWQADGNFAHPAKEGDDDGVTQTSTQEGLEKADATGDRAELVTNRNTNGHIKANNPTMLAIEPPRIIRSTRRVNERTDNTENHDQVIEKPAALSPVFEPISPTIVQHPRRKMNRTENDAGASANEPVEFSHAIPISLTRTTRSSRRAANRTDNTANDEEAITTDTIEPLPEISSPKTGRRTRRSTSILSTTPEVSRNLRSQSTVHELRDGTKYVDGRVPTENDGVHELRDGTKYMDKNISPATKAPSEREESLVHELRDGANYVDRGKSPDVRRSARNRRGGSGSVVHELRDGAKYTDV